MVIPNLVRQALDGAPMTVFGDGSQTRSFVYVGDTVRALVGLMNEPRAVGEVFNVGNDHEISIHDLAETIKRITRSSSEIITVPYEEAYEEGFEDIQTLKAFVPQVIVEDRDEEKIRVFWKKRVVGENKGLYMLDAIARGDLLGESIPGDRLVFLIESAILRMLSELVWLPRNTKMEVAKKILLPLIRDPQYHDRVRVYLPIST